MTETFVIQRTIPSRDVRWQEKNWNRAFKSGSTMRFRVPGVDRGWIDSLPPSRRGGRKESSSLRTRSRRTSHRVHCHASSFLPLVQSTERGHFANTKRRAGRWDPTPDSCCFRYGKDPHETRGRELDTRRRTVGRATVEFEGASFMVARTPSTAAFALLDCAFHVVWIMYCSCFGVMGSLLATRLGFLDEGLLTLVVFVVSALLVSPVAQGLGGLSMNPANEVALFAAGKMGYVETTVRVPATMIGGTLGAGMLLSVLPNEYVGYIPTPRVKAGATLSVGFLLEFCLSFANNLILLFCLGKPGRLVQSIPLVSVVASIVLFESYTGPMMNPALGWSWGYQFDSLKELETQLVFVGAPILGALAAGGTWKLLTRERETKGRQGRKKDD